MILHWQPRPLDAAHYNDVDNITNENSHELIPWVVHIFVFAPFLFNYIIIY